MSIETRVIDIVKDVLGMEGEKVTSEDTFEDLYIDSLDLVEIIIKCEKEFGYPITDDKVQNLKTVGDLVNLIKEQKYLFSEMDAAIEKIVDSYIIEGYSEKEARKLTYNEVMTIISRKLCGKY